MRARATEQLLVVTLAVCFVGAAIVAAVAVLL
jgi:hypothetical protein